MRRLHVASVHAQADALRPVTDGHGLHGRDAPAAPATRTDFEIPMPWYPDAMRFRIELEREDDGRWLGEVRALPGALAYGRTRALALAAVQALALRILADRLEHGGASARPVKVDFATAR